MSVPARMRDIGCCSESAAHPEDNAALNTRGLHDFNGVGVSISSENRPEGRPHEWFADNAPLSGTGSVGYALGVALFAELYGEALANMNNKAPNSKTPVPGEAPREIPEQSALLPPLAGPAYIRGLSRALVVWEAEVRLVRTQRDRAREAFTRLRGKAVTIEAERKRLREELKQTGDELGRLRSQGSIPLPSLDDHALRDVLGLNEEDTQPEIDAEPLSDDVIEELSFSDRESTGALPPLPPAEALSLSPTDNDTLVHELDEVRDEADRAWAECDELTVRLGEAEDGLAAAAASRESAERSLSELEKRTARLQAELEQSEKDSAALQAALAALEGELAASTERISDLRREIAEGSSIAQQAHEEASELREALAATQDSCEEERRKNTSAEARAAAVEIELRGAREELRSRPDDATHPPDRPVEDDAGVGFVETLAARLEEVRKESERWETKAARLKASLEVARAEADAAQQEATELRGDVENLRRFAAENRAAGTPPSRVVTVEGAGDEKALSPWLQLDEEGENALEAALQEASSVVGHETPKPPVPARQVRFGDDIPVEIEAPHQPTMPGGPVALDNAEVERLRVRVVALEVERDRLLQTQSQGAPPQKENHAPDGSVVELRNQLAQLRLERDLAHQRLRKAENGTKSSLSVNPTQSPAQRRAIAAALSLTSTRLAELPGLRQSGKQRQHLWQELLNQLGHQVSLMLRTVGRRPELAEAGVQPETLFQNMKRLAVESVDLFGDRDAILSREETVLNILKDRLGETQAEKTETPVPDRHPPTESMRRR